MMREHLLGHILGALDEAEHDRVARAVAEDAQLAGDCARLQARVAPLAYDEEEHAPPPRLALNTIAL
ncbi:MAG: hypothetical protein KDA41_13685, partial [Planctomycetales bacterium]|nr:hypothetical protein [Planctomycetales bacterium]